MTQVRGAFTVKAWDEKPYDEPAGLPKLAHAMVTHELAGDIEGEASISYLLAYREDKTANVVGLVRITGKIGAREGSFVMQDVGTYEGGVARGRWTVLPNFGTGAFKALRGDGYFAATHESASYQLDLDFE